VGRFLHLDPDREEITVSAPLPSPSAAERFRLVTFGRVRVGEDGAFLSDIKPGEIEELKPPSPRVATSSRARGAGG
jgi:hypothetical protein